MRRLPFVLAAALTATSLLPDPALAKSARSGESAAATRAPAKPVAGKATKGKATLYELQSGGGNCSYPSPPAGNLYVALSPREYAAAAACGGYVNVTGPKGTVQVKVVDQCPECPAGHIDLSRTALPGSRTPARAQRRSATARSATRESAGRSPSASRRARRSGGWPCWSSTTAIRS
ncbi:hypothetical protein ACTWPT_59325 [Nonomuraea sp. 3N208]|uniref:hypothetical protein n=1 Tax=Nonomuraea sp. 3N208 TaxID=3457421 RepID=UPI003FD5E9DD